MQCVCMSVARQRDGQKVPLTWGQDRFVPRPDWPGRTHTKRTHCKVQSVQTSPCHTVTISREYSASTVENEGAKMDAGRLKSQFGCF